MKKPIYILLVILIAAFALVGCQAQNEFVKLGQYKGIEMEKISPEEVTDDDIASYIDSILYQYTEDVKVTDRTAKEGDTLDIDYIGTLNGVAFEGGTAEGQTITLGPRSGYIDGFSEGLVGAGTGDELRLELTFPEDYGVDELDGQDVVFTVKVNGIYETITPEYTDEFVLKNFGFDTKAEFESSLLKDLEEEAAYTADMENLTEAWAIVRENTEILSLPKDRIKEYRDETYEYYKDMAKAYEMEFGEFLESYYMCTEDEFDTLVDEWANEAISDLIIVEAIAKAENITISDDEYAAGVSQYLTDSGYESDEEFIEFNGMSFEEFVGKDALTEYFLTDKVQQFVLDNAVEIK